MWYFQIYVTPKPEATEYGIYGGAFVNCWVNTSDRVVAEKSIYNNLAEQKWKVENLENCFEVTLDYYSDNQDGAKYYKDALESGMCLSFHTFPLDNSKSN